MDGKDKALISTSNPSENEDHPHSTTQVLDDQGNALPAKEPLQAPKDQSRRDFIVMSSIGVACASAAVGVIPFISSLSPSAEVLAIGSLEVDLSKIEAGKSITVMWRGQPTFVMHRTSEQIEKAQNVNLADLRDPQPDFERVIKGKEQWLVVIGVCTHLGCVPISNKGDYDGWLCPCHGSHYDSSARIRKGPAPLNLAVPPYKFISDTKIIIG